MICSYYLLTPNNICSINVITVIRGCHDVQLGYGLHLELLGQIHCNLLPHNFFYTFYTSTIFFCSIGMEKKIPISLKIDNLFTILCTYDNDNIAFYD